MATVGTGLPRVWALACVASLTLLGCQTTSTTKGSTVGVDRKQTLLVSSEQVNQMAEKQYAQVLQEASKANALNSDPALVSKLRGIAQKIVPHVAAFRSDAVSWSWEVNVIRSEQLNAWCMPGGKIAFYTGIIETLQLTEAEIAAIMGHEIAHALREHSRERLSEQQVGNAVSKVIDLVGSHYGIGGIGAVADTGLLYVMTLPNSRTHEREADRIGVELAARAGYDPVAAVRVWEKMERLSKGGTPEFLSTHPSNASRIKDLRKYAEKVYPLYLQAIS